MGSELARAKARAADAWTEAVQQSYKNVSGHIGHDYTFMTWSRSVEEQYINQWGKESRHLDAGWDWIEIVRRNRGFKDRTVALYCCGDRLSALSHFRVSKSRVLVGFLEGDPRPDCHIKGRRALLMLDLAATYGQRMGRSELHLQPVNEELAELYRSVYGFYDGKDGHGEPVLKRSLI